MLSLLFFLCIFCILYSVFYILYRLHQWLRRIGLSMREAAKQFFAELAMIKIIYIRQNIQSDAGGAQTPPHFEHLRKKTEKNIIFYVAIIFIFSPVFYPLRLCDYHEEKLSLFVCPDSSDSVKFRFFQVLILLLLGLYMRSNNVCRGFGCR